MVVDDTYYKVLEVEVSATPQQIKKSYRKLSLKYHPDKNPAPEAKERFQSITEAYQVLSSDELRAKYDRYGKESAVPEQGFEDATEYFAMIFGGEAFLDYIGELTLLKDLAKTAELSNPEEEPGKNNGQSSDVTNNEAQNNIHETEHNYTRRPDGSRLAIEHTASSEKVNSSTKFDSNSGTAATSVEGSTKEDEKEKNKSKLTDKQKEELEKYEEESRKKREETKRELAEKLVLKLSIWTESSKTKECLLAFDEKYKAEADLLKIESFGLDILHTIGDVYATKGSIFIKSQRFLGIGGFFSSVKEKAGVVGDTFRTISSALDAQSTMEEFSKMQEKEEGMPEPTPEEIAEMEKLLMGKVLAAAWHGSKFEIQGTVRGVCDLILYDKTIPLDKRIERAEALIRLGKVFKATTRTEAESEEARIFEELVAEAQKDKGRKQRKKNREERERAAAAAAAEKNKAAEAAV